MDFGGIFSAFANWIFDLVKSAFLAIWDMFVDLICFFFEQLLGVAVTLIGQIPINTTSFNPSAYLAGAPAEFLGMLVAIRLPEAVGIIVVALGIRFALQLIPFVRLGS